jgi:RNA polymerase sigma-70 factor, ECF subfamily
MEQDRRQHPCPAGTGELTGAARRTGTADDAFEQHRPVLLGIAYRMLGSMWDAEDVVQDAWLRWANTDRASVDDPRSFLITVTSRLAIDRLRLAYRQREAYVGPWLPEPVPSDELPPGPAEAAEQRDTVSIAVLRLMEELSPPERAVFVLREAFALPYDDIAATLELAAPNARQLHRRAVRRLDAGQSRFSGDSAHLRRLVDGFTIAAQTGNRHALEQLLAEDVALWSDGGGKVRAARRVVRGRSKVVRLLVGVLVKFGYPTVEGVEVNGQPGLLSRLPQRDDLLVIQAGADGIVAIHLICNPDKLARLLASHDAAKPAGGAEPEPEPAEREGHGQR